MQDKFCQPAVSLEEEPELQMRPDQHSDVSLLRSWQKTQETCAWTPDPQKIQDNKCLLQSAVKFVVVGLAAIEGSYVYRKELFVLLAVIYNLQSCKTLKAMRGVETPQNRITSRFSLNVPSNVFVSYCQTCFIWSTACFADNIVSFYFLVEENLPPPR